MLILHCLGLIILLWGHVTVYNNMQLQAVQLYGVTSDDIQAIYDNALREFKTRIFFLDASYLYTFHLDDFVEVRKFNLLGRYDIKANIEWHNCLERWYQDQTVTIGGRTFKPIKISRTLDRVVNEGMEMVANFVVGVGGANAFDCRGIGDGDIDEPSLGDEDLENRIDLINVNSTPEGGSISKSGTIIYSIGNHSKEVATPDNNVFTECGMFDDTNVSRMHMFDHSTFDDPVEHTQGIDSPGSTTVVYMCSG